ncbi:bifunctional folylpolyglutamate synthase/dihydrofolate synthase [bacterium]|nr:bifunctional folylpolyglutamate synthase/dihydrofolate synthase [bacterium]
MNFEQSLKYLYGFVDFERANAIKYDTKALDLRAFSELLRRRDDPQTRFKIVHVAGTKGKGSTCAMLASILKASGLSVGLFTSPHLLDVRERIQIDGSWISKDDFASLISEIEPIHTALGVARRCYRTTFELLTATALLHFAKSGVDFAVLETGLGGRLDSTNVVDPALCVITKIGYDHTGTLGNSIEAIAREKSGIIKANVPLVLAPQRADVFSVVQKFAADVEAPVTDIASEYRTVTRGLSDGFQTVRIEGPDELVCDARLPLLGLHQAENATCAVAAAQLLSRELSEITTKTMSDGLSKVAWYGRIEPLNIRPDVIVDCAHNEDSAEALVATLKSSFTPSKKIAIVGISGNKEARVVLTILNRYFDSFIATRASTPRAASLLAITEILDDLGASYEAYEQAERAAESGLSALGKGDLLCVTGSVYLAGELRPVLIDRLRSSS